MNYFEFFDLPVAFKVDEKLLKKRFLINSKKFHPDYYTLEAESKQLEILEKSSLNNEGYKTLKDANKRMKYVLEIKGALGKEGSNPLPQAFLMEMMDINEEIMDLQFDFDADKKASLTAQVKDFEQSLASSVTNILEMDTISAISKEDLQTVKDFYLKKKYLFRIYENLNKFAPDSI